MKKHRNSLLLVPVLVSLSCGNMHARNDNSGFIAGACAVTAAVLGAVGIAAAVDWCCSETVDQLINRTDREYHSIFAQYDQTIHYFAQRAGVGAYAPHRPIHYIPEDVLYEFGTFVWNSGMAQSVYYSNVWSARNTLQSCAKDLNKRINLLAGKYTSYEDQKRLSAMRNILSKIEALLADITLFVDCLEYHQTYFTLYDSVGNIRNRYLQHITILESGRYSVAAEIKSYILSYDTTQYAFMHFVKNIESDITTLQFDLHSLRYNYDAAQKYAQYIINQLIGVKNIVALDPRYQEELYQWEQARLARARIEAMEAQARLERDRIRIERERNKLMEKQIKLERQKMCMQPVVVVQTPVVETAFSVTFDL